MHSSFLSSSLLTNTSTFVEPAAAAAARLAPSSAANLSPMYRVSPAGTSRSVCLNWSKCGWSVERLNVASYVYGLARDTFLLVPNALGCVSNREDVNGQAKAFPGARTSGPPLIVRLPKRRCARREHGFKSAPLTNGP